MGAMMDALTSPPGTVEEVLTGVAVTAALLTAAPAVPVAAAGLLAKIVAKEMWKAMPAMPALAEEMIKTVPVVTTSISAITAPIASVAVPAIAAVAPVGAAVAPVAALPILGAAAMGGIGGITLYKLAGPVIDKLKRLFSKPPPFPIQAPDAMTQEIVIRQARERLGMDVVKQYNFGVGGQSGSGKSTFINSIRNLADVKACPELVYRENEAAPVGRGAREVTSEIRRYLWPNNEFPFIAIWDLPGGGTTRHPSATYFDDNILYAFDSILLLTTSRFTEVDFRIMEKACEYRTPIILVLTKVDQEIIKEHEDYPEKSLQQAIDDVVSELKDAVQQKLRDDNPKLVDIPIYAISATKFRKELSGQVANDCSSLEMWLLIDYCLQTAYNRRQSTI
ncbi:unnamed protein product [Adineta steineri]|uniref:IRG-type G domain-containing protein n=1 Tax=Adineta steineri TaxID=433720 RepID=A0A813ZLX7_9BILA|nr:unnamed protein product [Adineta steineri]CAF0929116.1 unnamed protein product [Adineta steineri]